jgi:hypothetical protein
VTDDLVKRLRAWAEPVTLGYEVPAAGQVLFDAADRIEQLEAALQLGVIMRHAQVAYFKDRSKENLIVSKQAEAAFDRAALGEKKDV